MDLSRVESLVITASLRPALKPIVSHLENGKKQKHRVQSLYGPWQSRCTVVSVLLLNLQYLIFIWKIFIFQMNLTEAERLTQCSFP